MRKMRHDWPNTSNIMVDFAEGEGLVISLDLKGVAVSTGSACSSGSLEPSHVLTAIGKTPDEAHGSLRFSLNSTNTAEEVDYVVEVLASDRRTSFANYLRTTSGPDMAYAAKLIDYLRNPRCVGEIENADAVAQVSNPVCGDVMKLWLKVDAGTITDAKFKAQGCSAAIATSSYATEMIIGIEN